MPSPHRWQKSSYCQEGDACLHISVTPTAIRVTDRDTPPRPVLTLSPAAFTTLLGLLKSPTGP